MEGLMMMQPGFEKKKNCRFKDDLLNGNKSAGLHLPHSWSPELEKGFLQAQEEALG
jgi:hypothetical protein